eukprot:687543_1
MGNCKSDNEIASSSNDSDSDGDGHTNVASSAGKDIQKNIAGEKRKQYSSLSNSYGEGGGCKNNDECTSSRSDSVSVSSGHSNVGSSAGKDIQKNIAGEKRKQYSSLSNSYGEGGGCKNNDECTSSRSDSVSVSSGHSNVGSSAGKDI